MVDWAKVIATSQGEGRAKKIIVFHYKPKVRYRKKAGHRQHYTRLAVDNIIGPDTAAGKPEQKTLQDEKEVTESGA